MHTWAISQPEDVKGSFRFWIARYKAAALTLGAGFSYFSDNKDIYNFLKTLDKNNDFNEFFTKMVVNMSLYGDQILFWTPTKDGVIDTFQLRINNPIYPMAYQYNGERIVGTTFAETWKSNFNQTMIRMITIDTHGMAVTGNTAIPNAAFGLDGVVNYPSNLNRSLENFYTTNTMSFERFMNQTLFNVTNISFNFRTPDTMNVPKKLYEQMEDAFDAIVNDTAVSQNMLISYADITISDQMSERRKRVVQTQILRSTADQAMGGVDMKTEIIKASPNTAMLWENFRNTWDLACQLSGYSYNQSGNKYETATEQHYNQSLDIQTTEVKRKHFEDKFKKAVGKMLIQVGLWDGIGNAPFSFEINDHLLTDKDKSLNRVIQLRDAGFITHLEAMMKLRPGLNEDVAKSIMLQAKDYMTKYPEFFNGGGQQSSGLPQDVASMNPNKDTQEKQQKKEGIQKE